jgi:hypothetical protein
LTKDEAREWKARWELAAARQTEELRKETVEEKFRALAFLMASVDLFDLDRDEAEEAVARDRWTRLRARARQ